MPDIAPNDDQRPVYIVTGLSGAGKSTALRAFEDMHFFTVDGLPASLAPEMATMSRKAQMGHFRGTAMGMDLRQDNFFSEFMNSMRQMELAEIRPKIIFLEADYSDLVRRYAATRRPHPLERKGLALEAAIDHERESLAPLKAMADLVINSAGFSIYDLRREIRKHIRKTREHAHELRVNVLSFGFKHGIPTDADFMFDLRFLPNPYFVDNLRPLTGKDREVAEYVFSFPQARKYMKKIEEMLIFALGQMETEGRSRATIAIGCTGGRHRSVAMTEEVAQKLRQADYAVMVEHRHLHLD